MTPENIQTLWLQVFPESFASVSKAAFSTTGYFIKGYLQKPDEWANKISHNDPLRYMGHLDTVTGTYEECDPPSLIQVATSPYMAYSSVKMRKKTIKNASPGKILKRFEEIKAFIQQNAKPDGKSITGIPANFDVQGKV